VKWWVIYLNVSIVIIYFICILYPAFPFKIVVYVIYFSCIDVKTNQSLELLKTSWVITIDPMWGFCKTLRTQTWSEITLTAQKIWQYLTKGYIWSSNSPVHLTHSCNSYDLYCLDKYAYRSRWFGIIIWSFSSWCGLQASVKVSNDEIHHPWTFLINQYVRQMFFSFILSYCMFMCI